MHPPARTIPPPRPSPAPKPAEGGHAALTPRCARLPADLSNPMRTWPTAADWAQRCLSEFFAQVRLETERLSAGGTASRRPACAGCTRCARACAATGQRVGAAPSREVRHVRLQRCVGCGVPFRATPRSGSACLSARCATARRHSSRSRRCGCDPKAVVPQSRARCNASKRQRRAHAVTASASVGRPAKRTCYSSLRDVRAVSAAPLLRAHALRSV